MSDSNRMEQSGTADFDQDTRLDKSVISGSKDTSIRWASGRATQAAHVQSTEAVVHVGDPRHQPKR